MTKQKLLALAARCEEVMIDAASEAIDLPVGPMRTAARKSAAEWSIIASALRAKAKIAR